MTMRKFLISLLVLTTLLCMGTVFAASKEYVNVNTTVTCNGKTLTNGDVISNAQPGDKIVVKASCSDSRAIAWSTNMNYLQEEGYTYNREGMAFISYLFDSTDKTKYIRNTKTPTEITITIPNFDPGSEHYVAVCAVAACDGLVDNGKEIQATSGSMVFYIDMKAKETESISMTLTKGSGKATAKATVTGGTFSKFVYNWDGASNKELTSNPADISFPTAVGKHKLTVYALTKNNVKSNVCTLDYEVKEPESISLTLTKGSSNATAKATVVSGTFSKFVYNWDGAANKELTTNPADISYPTAVGKHKLTVYAVTKNNVKSETKTLDYEVKDPTLDGDIVAKVNDKELSTDKSKPTTLNDGDAITVVYSPVENFSKIEYNWDDGAWKSLPVTRPTFDPGTTHKLTVKGTLKDGNVITNVYYVYIPKGEEPIPLTGTVTVKYDGKTLKAGSTTKLDVAGLEVEISGSPVENFKKIVYTLNNGRSTEELGAKGGSVKIDLESGVTKTLQVNGVLTDGTETTRTSYNFIYNYVEDDDDLDLEPWMIENDDAEGLIVSLRNSSETDKANMNFYMLDEEVIYYVDYKNAGKAIKDEVKLVLNIPLKFTALNAAGSICDPDKKTFTWTFKDGLDEGQAGTKVVTLKYTALSKKSLSSEVIYPEAAIYQKSKAKDYSAVINLIYKDDDTEIDDEHSPYMFGDREKPTFRPDDGISRAEGALVLMRIFNVNYQNAKITNKYSDIDQTYDIAQRAISKATELGVIKGYTDGTYRPNEKMTRAEFMKIIASYVEVLGEDENGLEVKDEEAIWLYKNSSNKNHWAVPYVTLLSRLNMTSVRKDKNLRLDDTITRAEVAQLCNFYLFRAPVKVTSNTKTDFSDVTRSHKLFADIVEATRDTHDVLVDEEGRETGK